MPAVRVDLGLADVRAAAERLAGKARRTPLLPAGELSRRVGARTLLKAENLQLTGSFKVRGALNKLSQLSDAERAAGVVAASAGNHAQGLAFAARELGIAATAVMPDGAPLAKIAAVKQYGGRVVLNEGSYDEARMAADELARRDGMTLVHAFDDPQVVVGQGTVGIEIAEDAPDVRLVVVPLGGGGLATGTAMAVKSLIPDARVVGVQAEACAPYPASLAAHRAIGARSANTICDGIAVKQPGELTLPLVERWIDEVVTVSDDEAAQAMVLLLERSKVVVEGAGAVGVAALMQGKVEAPPEGEVCAVLSGGNVDASLLAECIRLGETAARRRIVLATVVPDRPGALAGLLRIVADHGANVMDVEHLREGMDLHVRETAIQLVLQTNGPEHDQEILTAVQAEGFAVRLER
ncbi:MAG TPA: threonine ammonia-lyase [Thermoleophilaceae bacterium]|nr:threonine ammonia-lyase [Thermoleophilaceae bacterium]